MTEGQTFYSIPHIGIYVIQTHKLRFISFLILESTYDRRTDISFHHSYSWYWDLSYRRTNYDPFHPQIEIYTRQTDGQTTFHFIPHIGIHVWQTDRHFISSLIFMILGSVIQTDKLRSISPSNWNLHKTDRRTNYVPFHSSYWNPSKTDELIFISSLITSFKANRRTTTLHFIPLIGIQVRRTDGQTDKLWFISPLILEATEDKQTDKLRFIHPSYLNLSKADEQTTFCFTFMLWFKIDGQTTFQFIHVEIQVRQTDRQTTFFFSSLVLE